MERENLNKTIRQIFESKYAIPLYQRNFAWRAEEISRLLYDVWGAFARKQNHYFIGSLVVRKRMDDEFEVIDGQQRLTVLSLICKALNIVNERHLSYDSRKHVEEFLDALYANGNIREHNHPSVLYIKQAVETIMTTNIREESQGETHMTLSEAGEEFAAYFADNVILVRVEIPEDTDVTSYFEIMNNRGEQLQEHEILKSLLLSRAPVTKQKEFAEIWDVCSQMDEPVQKLFKAESRRRYFGESYDTFRFAGLTERESEGLEELTLEEIIKGPHSSYKDEDTADEINDTADECSYRSIIDFPNFLMHIIKAFYKPDTPLDSRFLLESYDAIKSNVDPEQFIWHLFRSRTFFDRFVVKNEVTDDKSEEDSMTWSLKRPVKKSKLQFNETFTDEAAQSRAMKALAMLQVTYRNRRYKNWLFELIRWFGNQEDPTTVAHEEYIAFLDNYILTRYDEFGLDKYQQIPADEPLTRENSYSAGTATPHFIFNFIDYLYWVESRKRLNDIPFSDQVRSFEFKYWNSVEHHLSQQKAKSFSDSENYVDNLGNLCLLSKSTNSRLSDRDVKEKVTYAGVNMGAKRQIMYNITRVNNYEWNHDLIRSHYNDVLVLLKRCRSILEC